jgi:hypothetical protein
MATVGINCCDEAIAIEHSGHTTLAQDRAHFNSDIISTT